MKSVERELSALIEVKEHTGSAAVLSVSRTHSGWHGAAPTSKEKAHRVCCCAEAKPHTMAGTVLRQRATKVNSSLHPELRSCGVMSFSTAQHRASRRMRHSRSAAADPVCFIQQPARCCAIEQGNRAPHRNQTCDRAVRSLPTGTQQRASRRVRRSRSAAADPLCFTQRPARCCVNEPRKSSLHYIQNCGRAARCFPAGMQQRASHRVRQSRSAAADPVCFTQRPDRTSVG